MTSATRSSTPTLVDTTNLYDYETPPFTPPHRIPLWTECPPPPRPLKRIFQASQEDLDFLCIPSSETALNMPETPFLLPKHNLTARPAPKRLMRRFNRFPVPGIPTLGDDVENVPPIGTVRIEFRRIELLDLLEEEAPALHHSSSAASMKPWPSTPPVVAKTVVKRRNSCHALSA